MTNPAQTPNNETVILLTGHYIMSVHALLADLSCCQDQDCKEYEVDTTFLCADGRRPS